MSRRGSAQLLLLFFRSRPRLGWTMGAIAVVLVLAALLQAGRDFPIMTRTGLAHLLRQTAWQHALAGLPEQAPWPWTESAVGPAAGVPQLGLSAAIVKGGTSGQGGGSAVGPIQAAPAEDPHLPRREFSQVSVGDRITVTAADGSSQVYRVTGGKVVDPHLAEAESVSGDDPAALTCLPLDPLLATLGKVDPEAPIELKPEQKL